MPRHSVHGLRSAWSLRGERLQALSVLCAYAHGTPAGMKAVQYAQACVCRAYDNCVAQAAASQQRQVLIPAIKSMHDKYKASERALRVHSEVIL
eukprot:scaffold118457_cov22-Tisochrysis_lutea.AAC.2